MEDLLRDDASVWKPIHHLLQLKTNEPSITLQLEPLPPPPPPPAVSWQEMGLEGKGSLRVAQPNAHGTAYGRPMHVPHRAVLIFRAVGSQRRLRDNLLERWQHSLPHLYRCCTRNFTAPLLWCAVVKWVMWVLTFFSPYLVASAAVFPMISTASIFFGFTEYLILVFSIEFSFFGDGDSYLSAGCEPKSPSVFVWPDGQWAVPQRKTIKTTWLLIWQLHSDGADMEQM